VSDPEPAAAPERQNRSLPGGAIGGLLRRASTVSFFTTLGVGVGFLVDVLLVARFGIGASTDAYFGGYTVPLIVVTCVTAIEPVLVTVLAGYREDKSAFSILLNAAALAGLAIAVLGVPLARVLVRTTAPGFSPETAAQATLLARIFFARVPATTLTEVCKAELYARRRFGLATFSNIFPGLLSAIVLALPRTCSSIAIVAASAVVGSLLQAAVLVAALLGPLHVRYHFTLRHATPLLGQTGRLLVAPLAGLLLRQGVVIAERIFGSCLPAGSVTALSYASRLTMTVAGIGFDGINTAALPSLAERWSLGPTREARRELGALLKFMIAVALPAGLMVAALASPLVLLLFQRGQVDRQGALLMGSLFGVYSLSLLGLGPFRAAQSFFYAAKEMRAIIVLHGGLTALTVLLDWILVRRFEAMGLALSFAISSVIIAGVALTWLARRGGDMGWRRLADSFWRLALAALAMAGVAYFLARGLQPAMQLYGGWGLVSTLALSGLAGLGVFLVVGSVLRAEPVSILLRAARIGCNKVESPPGSPPDTTGGDAG